MCFVALNPRCYQAGRRSPVVDIQLREGTGQISDFSAVAERLVPRLEDEAQRSGRLYVVKVLTLAMLGYAFVPLMLLAIGGVFAVIIYLTSAYPGLRWLAVKVLGIGYLVFAFYLLKACWVKLEPPSGRALSREEAPKLFELIERIRQDLGSPKLH